MMRLPYRIYFGCYYYVWMTDRKLRKSFMSVMRTIITAIYSIPYIKRNLAKRGKTPRETTNYVIKMGDKISDKNISHTFEGRIGLHLFLLFFFFFLDLLFILRLIFGYYWWGYYIGQRNVVAISWVIIILASVCMFAVGGHVGTDQNEKKFRRQSKKEQRKALWVYLGSFAFVLILFFLLWGHKILGL